MSNLAHTEGKEDVILQQIQKILEGGGTTTTAFNIVDEKSVRNVYL